MAKDTTHSGTLIFFIYSLTTLICCTATNLANTSEGVSKGPLMISNLKGHHSKRNQIGRCDNKRISEDVSGYPPLTKESLKVQFIIQKTTYIARIRWTTPKEKNGTSLRNYFFMWFSSGDLSIECLILKKTANEFEIKESKRWRSDWNLDIAVIPQPKLKGAEPEFAPFIPVYDDPASTSPPETLASLSTIGRLTSAGSNSSSLFTKDPASTSPPETLTSLSTFSRLTSPGSNQSGNIRMMKSIVVCVTGVALGIILLVMAAFSYHRKKRRLPPVALNEGHSFYVSYCPESEAFVSKVVKFTSWFRNHGYDVQMDIMQSSTNEKQLRELGRFRFGEMQLRQAKNVFMIVSPAYLKLCRLDEETIAVENLSQNDRIVYSEITHIRSELCSTFYRNCRFIPVLFGVKEIELPFWIKELVVYTWPDDKVNNRLLYRLNEQVEYGIV